MPKPMYVWSGSAWVSVATEVESLANFATQSYASAQPGMKMVVPTSVAVGSGSGSVDTNGAVTFSGASSVSINGCFSSTYQNYKIVFDLSSSAATLGIIKTRMRVSNTDASGANYYFSMNGLRVTNASSTRADNGATSGGIGWGSIGARVAISFDVYSPNTTNITKFTGTGAGDDGTATIQWNFGGFHGQGIAYDSISFIPDSSTMTGTIRIYGYKN